MVRRGWMLLPWQVSQTLQLVHMNSPNMVPVVWKKGDK